jgi:hypothetical protein
MGPWCPSTTAGEFPNRGICCIPSWLNDEKVIIFTTLAITAQKRSNTFIQGREYVSSILVFVEVVGQGGVQRRRRREKEGKGKDMYVGKRYRTNAGI